MTRKRHPSETPYLRVRRTEGSRFEVTVEIFGNAKALLRLRKQIDRALGGVDAYPFDDALYRELDRDGYEVVVRRARSQEEMREKSGSPRSKKTPEALPWAERTRE